MLDALPQIAIGLVIFLVVGFIGLGIAQQATTEFNDQATTVVIEVPAPVAEVATPAPVAAAPAGVDSVFGWLPMLILSILGGVALAAVFGSAMAPLSYDYDARPRERSRTEWHGTPTWTPPVRPLEPSPAPEPVRAPLPPPAPTEDEIVARDPEVAARQQEITAGDAALAALREKRERRNAERGLVERVIRWARRRSARREGT
jgi:hypothetical protein